MPGKFSLLIHDNPVEILQVALVEPVFVGTGLCGINDIRIDVGPVEFGFIKDAQSIQQHGLAVHLDGYAQSNARVSTLMRNIENSPWLQKPDLVEIKATKVDKKRLSEFTMNLSLTPLKPDEDTKDGKGDSKAKKG